jgi:RNA polymerase sigma-70 factor (ECF subfamily)
MQQEANFSSDSPSVEQLFKRYQPMLFRRAFRLVDEEDVAKDLVQNVFLQLWNNRDKVDFGPAIQGYLFKATTHAALNYLESNKRKRVFHQQIQRLSAKETTGGSETLAFRELQTNIQQAIDRLPPKCKVIFLLNRQEGLPYKQIAGQLDLSLKTVENQMGIALEKLREDLKPFLPRELVLFILLFTQWLSA